MSVQTVLSATGIPTYPGAWRPATDGDMPPAQYIVHTYARAPDQSADDEVAEYAVYAYVNLYSTTSPDASIALIRAAALAAGWGEVDERGSLYDAESGSYQTAWTFLITEAV